MSLKQNNRTYLIFVYFFRQTVNVLGGGLVLHINRLLEPVPFDFQNLQNSDQHESIWLELNHPESVRNSAGGPLQRSVIFRMNF